MPGEIIGQDYDPDFSHAMLVAVLVKLGGHIDLDASDLTPDALGNPEGVLYQMQMEPIGGTTMRLSVMPTAPDQHQSG